MHCLLFRPEIEDLWTIEFIPEIEDLMTVNFEKFIQVVEVV